MNVWISWWIYKNHISLSCVIQHYNLPEVHNDIQYTDQAQPNTPPSPVKSPHALPLQPLKSNITYNIQWTKTHTHTKAEEEGSQWFNVSMCVRVCPVVKVVNNATSPLKFYTGKKRSRRNQIWIYTTALFLLSLALGHAYWHKANENKKKQPNSWNCMNYRQRYSKSKNWKYNE